MLLTDARRAAGDGRQHRPWAYLWFQLSQGAPERRVGGGVEGGGEAEERLNTFFFVVVLLFFFPLSLSILCFDSWRLRVLFLGTYMYLHPQIAYR